jgi:predicted GNAT family acetyltransferase
MTDNAQDNDVKDNTASHRFELALDGATASSEYRLSDNVLTLMHTEVPKALEGRGIGSRLARGILDRARARGLKVRALCPFIKAYIGKHPEYADLT